MKKTLFITAILFLVTSYMGFAGKAEKFTYDSRQVEKQMSGLNKLENFLNTNPGLTFTEMTTSGNTLLDGIEVASPVFALFEDGKSKSGGGGGSFILGCCVGSGLTILAAAGAAYYVYYVYLQTALI